MNLIYYPILACVSFVLSAVLISFSFKGREKKNLPICLLMTFTSVAFAAVEYIMAIRGFPGVFESLPAKQRTLMTAAGIMTIATPLLKGFMAYLSRSDDDNRLVLKVNSADILNVIGLIIVIFVFVRR